MRASVPFSESRNKLLSDPELASIYLDEILADDDIDLFKLALKHVVDAHPGGMTFISQETQLNRESLYRALSKKGNPSLDTLIKVLGAVGLRISVVPQTPNSGEADTLAVDSVH